MKPRIAIFGRMNAGKSSLVNFLTGQNAAIVSARAGTTTDPVRRAFELIDYGAVVFIDTAGFDDTADDLGRARVAKTLDALDECDLVLFVPFGQGEGEGGGLDAEERQFLDRAAAGGGKPVIVVKKPFDTSLLSQIRDLLPERSKATDFFGGRISRGDRVVLVCPIDDEAPAGKLIMPQVAAVRSALDLGAVAVVVQVAELAEILASLTPRLVVTDSQAFGQVSSIVPSSVELTSFSILLAEAKGDKEEYKCGLKAVKRLSQGDKVLIVEHCSHEVSCNDIARYKIPRMLQAYAGCDLSFRVLAAREGLPSDLASYALVVQCGGCVATAGAITARIEQCRRAWVPITNYGMLLRELS